MGKKFYFFKGNKNNVLLIILTETRVVIVQTNGHIVKGYRYQTHSLMSNDKIYDLRLTGDAKFTIHKNNTATMSINSSKFNRECVGTLEEQNFTNVSVKTTCNCHKCRKRFHNELILGEL